MLRFPVTTELSDDIFFFHRPLPPEDADLIDNIEASISELLFAEETLADVIYRFAENDDGLLIAVAREKALRQIPLPVNSLRYRIPTAIAVWLGAKAHLQPSVPAFLYATHAGHAYLLRADALRVRNVYRFESGLNDDVSVRNFLSAIDTLLAEYKPGDARPMLYSSAPLPEKVSNELRSRSIGNTAPAIDPLKPPFDRAVLDQWDFRLPSETAAQEQNRMKSRLVQVCLAGIGAVAALWLLLFSASLLLAGAEDRAALTWQKLHGSLKEISYLQKQTRSNIAEIMLCQRLSEKRTSRAAVLEQAAAARPSQVKLEELRISGRKKVIEKHAGTAAPAVNEVLTLKGYSDDGNRITEWMELLLKSGMYASVNLVSMEKKDGRYRFIIECALPAQQQESP